MHMLGAAECVVTSCVFVRKNNMYVTYASHFRVVQYVYHHLLPGADHELAKLW
jgi:hypothetical protein